jgi:NADH dehydrogenase
VNDKSQKKRIVIIGGGYAGIHASKAIADRILRHWDGEYEVILIDQHPYHLRKVKLFKSIVSDENIRIPFSLILDHRIRFVQARVVGLDPSFVSLEYPDGSTEQFAFDRLVLALGSSVIEPPAEMGGIALSNVANARRIRDAILSLFREAERESDENHIRQLLTVSVVGGGISGIETSAELSHWMKREAAARGWDEHVVQVQLVDAQEKLLPAFPEKVSRYIGEQLAKKGVTIIQGQRATGWKEGMLHLESGIPVPTSLCIWTLGLKPARLLEKLGLPLDEKGKIVVDSRYHIKGYPHLYAIGDCAKVVDPNSGKEDAMTCKEAIKQASILAKVMKADLAGRTGPEHKSHIPLFCIHLGDGDGLFWFQKFKMDFLIGGKWGGKMREYTWDMADFLFTKKQKRMIGELSVWEEQNPSSLSG